MPIFDKKKQVPIRDLINKAARSSAAIPGAGGKFYPRQELAKALKELLPYKNSGSYLSLGEAKVALRKLRSKEYKVSKGDQKLKLNRLRRILEAEWGLKGKY